MFERLVDLLPLSEVRKQVLSQTAVQILGKAITVIGTFLVVRLLTSRTGLGSFGFGQFTIITTYVAYFYLLLDFGLNTVYVQWATERPEEERPLLSQLLSLRVGLSLIMVLAGLAIMAFLPADPYTGPIKVGIIAGLVTVLMQGLFMTGNAYFQLKLKYQVSVAVAILSAILNLAATYVALKLGFGLAGALLAYILEFVILGIGAVLMVRRYIPFGWRASWRTWREFVLAAMPLGLSIVLTLLYFRSDTFLLGVLHLNPRLGMDNTHAVAYYGLPYSMFEVFLTVPAFLMNATYPLMLKAFQKGIPELRDLLRKTLLLSLAFAVAMVVIIWALAPLAIHLQTAFNPDFERSILVLRLLGIGLPVFFVTNVLVFTLITLGYKRWLPGVYVLAGVVNIALNLWLLPIHGIVAAALTTGVTEVLILLLLIALTWSAFGRVSQNGVAANA